MIGVLYNAMSARLGGGLSYACHQVEALAEQPGVELTVLVAPWNEAVIRDAVDDRVEVRTVRVAGTGARVVWEQVVLPWIARRHDVLVSPGNFAALVCPVPQVVVLQNPHYVGRGRRLAPNRRVRSRVKAAFSHLSMRRADAVIAISDDLADQIAAEPGLARVAVTTIRSGVPEPVDVGAPAIAAAREMVGDEPYVVSVANDSVQKRLTDVASILPLLDRDDREVPRRIVFAGDISEERRAEMRDRAGRPDGLVFLGPVADRETVLALFRGAAAAVITSELEAWPLTLHEATSQGCPLVASDIPPHREVAGDLARYVPVGDLDGFASTLGDAVTGPRPEPAVNGHGWSEHGARVVDLLRAVVDGRTDRTADRSATGS